MKREESACFATIGRKGRRVMAMRLRGQGPACAIASAFVPLCATRHGSRCVDRTRSAGTSIPEALIEPMSARHPHTACRTPNACLIRATNPCRAIHSAYAR